MLLKTQLLIRDNFPQEEVYFLKEIGVAEYSHAQYCWTKFVAVQDLALCSLLGKIYQMHVPTYNIVHWHIKMEACAQ